MGFRETLVHLFIPHHSNNHRPKLLHIDALSAVALFFLLFNISTRVIHKAVPNILGYATDIYVDQLLSATNEKRANSGLAPLTLNIQLSQAAAAKASNMFTENYWAHNSPSGKTPWVFISGAGYQYTLAGENLAKNFMDSRGVVDAWMNSPSHRENILKAGYKEVGFAIVNGVLNGEETTLVVQMFGSRTTAIAQKPVQPVSEGRTVTAVIPTAIPITVTPGIITRSLASNEPLVTPTIEIKPVREVASENTQNMGNFAGITIKPLFNLATIGKNMVYIYIFIMMIILAVDFYIVSRKKIVRATGHNIAHFLFFTALFILSIVSYNGSIL